MQISFHDRHAYPGCLATIREREGAMEAGQATAIVEFSDGTQSIARIVAASDGRLRISMAPYRTAKGTPITATDWDLQQLAGDNWKVIAKARPA